MLVGSSCGRTSGGTWARGRSLPRRGGFSGAWIRFRLDEQRLGRLRGDHRHGGWLMGRLLLGCIAVFIAVAGSGVTAEATAGNGDWGQAGGGPSHSGNAHKQLGIAPSTVAGLHVVWSDDFGGEPD